jgi:UDP-3-O-acyl-N-acetylglucosamine deacetylase
MKSKWEVVSTVDETVERSVLLWGAEFQRKIIDSSCQVTPLKITDTLFRGDISNVRLFAFVRPVDLPIYR